jgi:hypothetical protein
MVPMDTPVTDLNCYRIGILHIGIYIYIYIYIGIYIGIYRDIYTYRDLQDITGQDNLL